MPAMQAVYACARQIDRRRRAPAGPRLGG
jgi:hypothetical protein